jgi:tetratricopeptide (TPR) repeat protein
MLNKLSRPVRILLVIAGLLILAVAVYNIPYVNDRLSWRLDDLTARVNSYFAPPPNADFVPNQQAQIDAIVTATMLAMMQTPTLTPTPAITAGITPEGTASPAGPSPTATITSTPPPASITLSGVVYVDQTGGYNLCGPSNLTMALKFWKWKGTRDDILKEIKPGINDSSLVFWKRGQTDKNVMPYELVDYVNNNTDLHALSRYGGDLNVIKAFVAAGYPVLIEKGEFQRDTSGLISWMGHYQFITGYNDASRYFLIQDTYLDGPNFKVNYDKLSNDWRAFNYIFMIVYPADREQQVQALLGDYANPQWANQHALDIADQETKTQTGLDSYFAWFNKGTSHVQLLQYFDAATAYDQSFAIFRTLPLEEIKKPYRNMWYQTGPYKAYYYTGRYQDVINLANITFPTTNDYITKGPTLEESLYWRGMAEQASGNLPAAVADYKAANHLNAKMPAIIQALQSVSVAPETPVKP